MLHTAHLAYPEPLLRTRSSGLSGSGYSLIHVPDEDGKATVVPGVTTVTKWLPDGGLRQYEADQVAVKAVTNIDALLNRTEGEGVGFLRFAGKNRTKYLGAVGTNWWAYVTADLAQIPLPPIQYPEVVEMVDAWNEFKWQHSVNPVFLEGTVANREERYAGTFDLIGEIDGVMGLWDGKTSTALRTGHFAQLAALGTCDELLVLDPDGEHEYVRSIPEGWDGETRTVRGEERAVTRWRLEPMPPFSAYGFLHARPAENGLPAFCDVITVSQDDIDDHWDVFRGMLTVARGVANVERRHSAEAKEEK